MPTRKTHSARSLSLALGSSGTVCLLVAVALGQSNISPVNKWSWGENIGWHNWYDNGVTSGARIEPSGLVLSGFIWSESTGWLYLGDGAPDFGATYSNATAADTGVNIGPGGFLSGFAWGENIGWVNFDTLPFVGIASAARAQLCCPNWMLSGFVWGENVGWINLASPLGFVGLGPSVTPGRGDMDVNGLRNGLDVQGFLETFMAPGSATFWEFCAADMDGSGVIDMADTTLFTNCLLNGTCLCP